MRAPEAVVAGRQHRELAAREIEPSDLIGCEVAVVATAKLLAVDTCADQAEPGCTWPVDAASQTVRFTADDRHLVHATERSIVVREVPSGVVRQTRELPFEVNLLACSPDGEHVAATTYDPEDRSLFILDLATGELRRFESNVKPFSLVFLPDGSRVVTGNRDDGTVSLWDVERGLTQTLTDLEGTIQRVAVSPDGTRIAAVDSAGDHRIWDARPIARRGERSDG